MKRKGGFNSSQDPRPSFNLQMSFFEICLDDKQYKLQKKGRQLVNTKAGVNTSKHFQMSANAMSRKQWGENGKKLFKCATVESAVAIIKSTAAWL